MYIHDKKMQIMVKKDPFIINLPNPSSNIDLTLSQTTNSRLFKTERLCRRQFQI